MLKIATLTRPCETKRRGSILAFLSRLSFAIVIDKPNTIIAPLGVGGPCIAVQTQKTVRLAMRHAPGRLRVKASHARLACGLLHLQSDACAMVPSRLELTTHFLDNNNTFFFLLQHLILTLLKKKKKKNRMWTATTGCGVCSRVCIGEAAPVENANLDWRSAGFTLKLQLNIYYCIISWYGNTRDPGRNRAWRGGIRFRVQCVSREH